jgi:GntR family transcriptional regulator
MFVDKNSPIPAYYQLRGIILDKVHSGEYPAGSLIPSERDLSQNLGISRMTVRQALNQLVRKACSPRKGQGDLCIRIKAGAEKYHEFLGSRAAERPDSRAKILHFAR